MGDNNRASFRWSVKILNNLIGYCYKKSTYITVFRLRNLQKLMKLTDLSQYVGKAPIINRIEFINRTLEARLDKRLNEEELIIAYACKDDPDTETEEIIRNLTKYRKLEQTDIEQLSQMIEDRLIYGTIKTKFLSRISEIYEKEQSGEFNSYSDIIEALNEFVRDYSVAMRNINSINDNGVMRFNSSDLFERVEDIKKRLGLTSSIIVTGIQMLNNLLGQGYRGSKLYTYAALPANFKSGLLLKTALDTMRYNNYEYLGKKEGYKKAVVYFTMENTIDETFERIYNMTIDNSSITEHSTDSIVGKLKKAGIVGNNNIELITVYKPNRSITTKDIDTFIEQLSEDHVEVVLLCFDYIKRIKPYEYAATEKEELKNVTNELKQIGIDYDIPIVTAAQLNRQAATVINEKLRGNRDMDVLKSIDSSMIGSAWEIMENSDVVVLINMMRDKKKGKRYLEFSCVKQRYHAPQHPYFIHPFQNHTMNLDDDINHTESKSILTLSQKTDFIDVEEDDTVRGRRTQHGNINSLDDYMTVKPL